MILTSLLIAIVVAALVYRRRQRKVTGSDRLPRVSVVVITLNEEETIRECVEHLQSLNPPVFEIIVSDGGSQDDTVSRAKEAGADKVIVKTVRGRGRAKQMNAGYESCSSESDVVMFVHADSRPPVDAVRCVADVMQDEEVALAGFKTRISVVDSEKKEQVLWFPTIHQYFSYIIYPFLLRPIDCVKGLRCLFGDQCMFCRIKDFSKVKFDESLVIMEDVDLCLRMHRMIPGGRIARVASSWSVTSGRRIQAWGPIKSTYIQMRIGLGWFWGMEPEELYKLYHRLYTDSYR